MRSSANNVSLLFFIMKTLSLSVLIVFMDFDKEAISSSIQISCMTKEGFEEND